MELEPQVRCRFDLLNNENTPSKKATNGLCELFFFDCRDELLLITRIDIGILPIAGAVTCREQ
jgi:hypothetical protein